MNLSIKTSIALVTLVCLGSSTFAQEAVTTPISNWSYQRHSSTAAEGFLRGKAEVVKAVGQSNYLNSVASVNLQEARRRAIENSNRYVRTYFENKEIIRQYREKYKEQPPTKEQWAKIVAASLPNRLTSEQYDRSSGTLVWPHILRMDAYTAVRQRIDHLMGTLTVDNSGDGSPAQRELATLVDAMKRLLKDNIESLTSSQYGAAKSFLLSLEYELLLPYSNDDLAVKTAPTVNLAAK